MSKLIIAMLFLCVFVSVNAQQNAVTERGEEVVLYDDGTWRYLEEKVETKDEIPTNPKKFKKDKGSSFLLKSSNLGVGFWINPKEWSFKKASNNAEAEYELELKQEDLYGMVISEKIEIPLETLKNIALDNGREAAPDLKIVKEEYRNVNGLKVLFLQMDGTMQGIEFSYYGYYFSNEEGTIQFITYTAQSLMEAYKSESEKLLNGFVLLD